MSMLEFTVFKHLLYSVKVSGNYVKPFRSDAALILGDNQHACSDHNNLMGVEKFCTCASHMHAM